MTRKVQKSLDFVCISNCLIAVPLLSHIEDTEYAVDILGRYLYLSVVVTSFYLNLFPITLELGIVLFH